MRGFWIPVLLVLLVPACGGGGGSGPAGPPTTTTPVTMTLTGAATGPSEIALSWTAEAPNPSYTILYQVYRVGGAVPLRQSSLTSFQDLDLAATTQYCYVIQAVLANQFGTPLFNSGKSNDLCLTTQGVANWPTVTVGSGSFVSLALNAAGRNLLSFRNAGGVQFATDAGGALALQTIDAGAGAGESTAIAVSGAGAANVLYLDNTPTFPLRYATNRSGAWAASIVDPQTIPGYALAMDGAGNAHAVYRRDQANIRYATNAGGTWLSTPLLISGIPRSAAVDGAGAVHIVVTEGACGVRYVKLAAGFWTDIFSDAGTTCGASMTLDSGGFAHLAYFKANILYHATNRSGAFVVTPVDSLPSTPGVDVNPSIAVDANFHAHISYQDRNADLKYATNAGGSWQSIYVAAAGMLADHHQIRVDAAGNAHIAYTDASTGTVKLATSP
jgi:hypothetical protein